MTSPIKLIVGLGNPGTQYEGTRHNAGSFVVNAFARSKGTALHRSFFSRSRSGLFIEDGVKVLLAVPVSYMNLSGGPVTALVKKHGVTPGDLVVVCDDIALDPGRIRFRQTGSSGGHNGLKSVIAGLGTENFCRLRIGIGCPPRGRDAAEYVLSAFTREEKPLLEQARESAMAALESWIKNGIEKTMNEFNR